MKFKNLQNSSYVTFLTPSLRYLASVPVSNPFAREGVFRKSLSSQYQFGILML